MIFPTVLFVNFPVEIQSTIAREDTLDYVFTPTISSFIREFETRAGVAIIVILDDTSLYKTVRKYFSKGEVAIKVLHEQKDTVSTLGFRLTNERKLLSFSSHVACHRKCLEWFGFLPVSITTEPRPGDFLTLKKGESLLSIGSSDERFMNQVFYVKWEELGILRDSISREKKLEEQLSRKSQGGPFLELCEKFLMERANFSYPDSIVDEFRLYLIATEKLCGSDPAGKKLIETLVGKGAAFEHSMLLGLFLVEICLKLKIESREVVFKYVLAALFHDLKYENRLDLNEETFIDLMRGVLDPEETYSFISHGERSVESLSKIPLFPEDSLLLILSHHEWVDGSGFPRGYGSDRLTDFQLLFNTCHRYLEHFLLSQNTIAEFFKYSLHFENISGLKLYRSRFLRLLEKIER